MNKKSALFAFVLVVVNQSATSQTTVTSSGATGTTNNVPYVSAASSSSTTLSPSPMSVSNGNIGIGTSNPGATLDVLDSPAYSSIAITARANGVFNSSLTNWSQSELLLNAYNPSAPTQEVSGWTVGAGNNYTDSGVLNNYFYIWNDQGPPIVVSDPANNIGIGGQNLSNCPGVSIWCNAALFVSTNSTVGIGTTTPQYALDVNGQVRASTGVVYPDGSQQTTAWTGVLCGGDYAEDVDGKKGKHYEPGDVLVLASDDDGEVERSAEPYSTLVAGIYATKPGVIGKRLTLSASAEELPMAMVGIVPTKVTTENGPIHKGDLLVTSSKAGYAMKGTDRAQMLGAVIGKAMGSLDSGTGVIQVLVTLQ